MFAISSQSAGKIAPENLFLLSNLTAGMGQLSHHKFA